MCPEQAALMLLSQYQHRHLFTGCMDSSLKTCRSSTHNNYIIWLIFIHYCALLKIACLEIMMVCIYRRDTSFKLAGSQEQPPYKVLQLQRICNVIKIVTQEFGGFFQPLQFNVVESGQYF